MYGVNKGFINDNIKSLSAGPLIDMQTDYYGDITGVSPSTVLVASIFALSVTFACLPPPFLDTSLQCCPTSFWASVQSVLHSATKLTVFPAHQAFREALPTDCSSSYIFLTGAPLAGDDIQYGIVSSGIGCGQPGVPGIYTNIYVSAFPRP